MNTRYPGAQPFSVAQQRIFFGREKELDELHRAVQSDPLVVLYAKSGLGKSSLLSAGLIPLVKELGRWQPISIRFGAYTEGNQVSPLDHARGRIREELSEQDTSLERIKPQGENSLWYALKTRQLTRKERGFMLVFDQFEELFTYPEEVIQAFGRELSELLFTTIPDRFRVELEAGLQANAHFLNEAELKALHEPFALRVVTAIRSDRMSLMNKLKPFLPNILENCYELRALRIEDAESAILSPAYLVQEAGDFSSPQFDYDDEAVSFLINFLSEGRTQPIESFQLQILCEYAEREVVLKQGRTLVQPDDVADPEFILENYYLGKIEQLPETDRLPARRLIEEGLVFEEEERRLTLYEGQIRNTYGVHPDLLRQLLDTHLIRSEPSLKGGYTYELSHDTLVAPVLKAKAKRLEAERKEQVLAAQRAKEAELAELRRQAAAERRRAQLAILFTVLALALAVLAGWSYWEANKSKQLAEEKTALALEAEKQAIESADLAAEKTTQALIAREEADESARLANIEEQKAMEAQKEAEAERNKVVQTLGALERANESTVRLLLKEADRDILNLRYEQAGEKIASAEGLGALKQEVSRAYLELVFWYGETGDEEQANTLLKKATALQNRTLPGNLSIRDAIQQLDKSTYDTLMQRYYPYMVPIPGGEFTMGCDPSYDKNCNSDEKQVPRKVSNFQMARYETTWWQYALFCKATERTYEAPGWGTEGNNPVVNVNWHDAVAYANWVSERRGLKAIIEKEGDEYNLKQRNGGYRLPSEAEWEYAARAGQDSVYAGSNELDSVGWYRENSRGRTQAFGLKKPNAFGLYDMSGNVWEWCWDWYDDYGEELLVDYFGPDRASYRVFRGGGWRNSAEDCRAANRYAWRPTDRDRDLGFRLALSLEAG